MTSVLTSRQIADFNRDGYVYARGLFDAQETDLLRRAMEQDPAVREHILDRADGEGGATKIALWTRTDNDTWKHDDDRYYVPLLKVQDRALVEAGLRFADGNDQEHFTSRPYVPEAAEAADKGK